MYDHSKLRGKIKEKFGAEYKMASLVGLSQAAFSAKLNSKVDFTRDEICRITELLELDSSEFKELFFLKK